MSLVSFQTISVRSIYIKIINYSGSIFVNLNNTIQTKQHATKCNKNNTNMALFFVVEGFLSENVQNLLQFLLIQQVETVFNISLFLEVLFFLCSRDI